METRREDLRTDQERGWDEFENFLHAGRKGQQAIIKFAGDEYRVKLFSRSSLDGEEIVTFRVLGERYGLEGDKLAFNLSRIEFDDTELVKLL